MYKTWYTYLYPNRRCENNLRRLLINRIHHGRRVISLGIRDPYSGGADILHDIIYTAANEYYIIPYRILQ
jgi:hypothetical protein